MQRPNSSPGSARKPHLADFLDTAKPVATIGSPRAVSIGEGEAIEDAIRLFMGDVGRDYSPRAVNEKQRAVGQPASGRQVSFSVRFRKLFVVDSRRKVRGIITLTDILDFLGADEKHPVFKKNGMAAKVSDIMSPVHLEVDSNSPIHHAISLFKSHKQGTYPLVSEGRLSGVLSESDMLKTIHRPVGLQVRQAMTVKPFAVDENHTIFEASKSMCKGGFRRLPVLRGEYLSGIITPYDIVSHLHKAGALHKLRGSKTPTRHVMRSDPVTIQPGADLHEAIKIMREHRIGGLPVTYTINPRPGDRKSGHGDQQLIGFITERDILDCLLPAGTMHHQPGAGGT